MRLFALSRWILALAVLAAVLAPVVQSTRPVAADGPALLLNPNAGLPGTRVVAAGTGFPADADGRLVWAADGGALAAFRTDPAGAFAVEFGVPEGAAGTYPVLAEAGGAGASADFALLPPPTPVPAPTEPASPAEAPAPPPADTQAPAPAAPVVVAPPTAPPPVVWAPFADDFETGDLRRWAAVDGLAVGTQETDGGTFAARAASAASGPAAAQATLAPPQADVYAHARVKVLAQGDNPVTLLRFRAEGGESVLGVYLGSTGKLSYRAAGAAQAVTTGATLAADGAWHTLQVRALVNGAAGGVQLWLDGALVHSQPDHLGTAPIGRLQLGESETDRVFDLAFDAVFADVACVGGPAACPADLATPTPAPTATAAPTQTAAPTVTSAPAKATPTPTAGTRARLAAAAVDPAPAFAERGGQVVIEAEHAHARTDRGGKSWTDRTDQAGYVGSGFVAAEPDTGAVTNGGYAAGSPELRYDVDFATAGTYTVWLRGLAATSAADSVHVGLDGAETASADRIQVNFGPTWRWSSSTMDGVAATLTVKTPGRHTVHVWMREDGFRLDRLVLSIGGGAPSGSGPAESPRVGSAAPTATTAPAPSATPPPAPTVTPPPAPTVTPSGSGSGSGLSGQYFDNRDFTNPKLTRLDPTVNFAWGTGAPAPGVDPNSFSVRWTGEIRADFTQTYTFSTVSNDGVRLWVGGQKVIENWTNHAATENSGTIALEAGRWYPLTLEYYENDNLSVIQLSYASPSTAKRIVPSDRLRPGAPPTPGGTAAPSPTAAPTATGTAAPAPTATPTRVPTQAPTVAPTQAPTQAPTAPPATASPTPTSAATATTAPTRTPSPAPTATTPPPSGTCAPTLQAQIDAAPAGSTLRVLPCVYRESVTVSKALIIEGAGAEIRGSDVWTGWTATGGDWTRDGLPAAVQADGKEDGSQAPCGDETGLGGDYTGGLCNRAEQVFIDGQAQHQLPDGADPGPGQFSVSGATVRIGTSPTGRSVEVTTRRRWMFVSGANVTVRGFAMRHAAAHVQRGGLQCDNAPRFRAENINASWAHGANVSLRTCADAHLGGSELSFGGTLGLHCTGAVRVTVIGNRIHHNDTERLRSTWEGAGVKCSRQRGSVFEGNTVTWNQGPGIWCDIDCRDVRYQNNVVTHNGFDDQADYPHGVVPWGRRDTRAAGLIYEISTGGVIVGNQVRSCAKHETQWAWGAGIQVQNSQYTVVTGNTVDDCGDGVVAINQKRGETDVTYRNDPRDNAVYGNCLLGIDGTAVGFFQSSALSDFLTPAMNNRGHDNQIIGAEGGSERYRWSSGYSSVSAFNGTAGGSGWLADHGDTREVSACS